MRTSLIPIALVSALLGLVIAPNLVVGVAIGAAVIVVGIRWFLVSHGPFRRRGVWR